jgi:predicted O-methyltransferase YrrM
VDILDPRIDRYLQDLATDDDPVLRDMERLAAERSFPIVGPQVGRLLHLLASLAGARRVFELGSGFGYSAYWFSRAVGPDGEVVLTEGSAERAAEAAAFLERGGFSDRVRIEVGDALEFAARAGDRYDVVFNDVDKHQYPAVPPLAERLLRPGGLLISDNMLWRGSVTDDEPADDTTRGVVEMTRLLYGSDRFDTVLLPVRDGVSVSVLRDGG